MAVSAKPVNNKRKFDKPKSMKPAANNKIKFEENAEADPKPVNKRIVFDDDGESAAEIKPNVSKKGKQSASNSQKASDIGSKWYQEVMMGCIRMTTISTY